MNQATPVFQKIDSSRTGGETITIEGKAPRVDVASTSQSRTVPPSRRSHE
jgi:hypothetical protein